MAFWLVRAITHIVTWMYPPMYFSLWVFELAWNCVLLAAQWQQYCANAKLNKVVGRISTWYTSTLSALLSLPLAASVSPVVTPSVCGAVVFFLLQSWWDGHAVLLDNRWEHKVEWHSDNTISWHNPTGWFPFAVLSAGSSGWYSQFLDYSFKIIGVNTSV